MTIKIVILTNAYPFLPGEQFFDDEIGYWLERHDARITLMPAVAKGRRRDIPPGVTVNTSLASGTWAGRCIAMLQALVDGMFRREIAYLSESGKLGLRTALRALLHSSKVLQQARELNRYIAVHGEIDVAYCYWNDTQSYAALLAKANGWVRKVVSRAHGADLYEFRRPCDYMPLKRQFIRGYDRFFVLTPQAASYLQSTYGALPESVEISPLGVPLDGALARPSSRGCVHIVSVSFCLAVKRLDKIVEAVALFAAKHSQVRTKWTHVGGGPQLESIKSLAQARLGKLANVTYSFRGDLPHEDVRGVFLSEPVDVFVNASESEGLPVSIMEAMSAGVPVVAPDVGGISCLVSDRCGVLMSHCPDSQEVSDAIAKVALTGDWDALRANARGVIEQKYSASTNYRNFIANVLSIDGRRALPMDELQPNGRLRRSINSK